MAAPASSAIVQACERLTGASAEALAFATAAPFLQNLGIETLVLWPGNINQAHQVDEYLAVDQIRPGIDLIRQLINEFCLQ
ncbi:M20/M25/M40 family metallo-hydrolase [Bacterioplanoides pacificum]|uniref:M20/M25/M40 family metallo-hydrolase n=1 Tax=Bacterioplanoides pacificum TaxID=1171596 RepID=A0ABV7VQJ0_9GAMM